MRKIVSRPNPRALPPLPLPFHVRSVGYHEAPCGWFERVPGSEKNFVQLFWCVGGRGEVIREEESFRVGEGEVFYQMPLEEHYHRSVDPERKWRYYWFTFDGPGAAAFMTAYGYPHKAFYAGECPARLFLEIETLLKERSHYAQRHAIGLAAEILALAGGTLAGKRGDHDPVREFIDLAHEYFADPDATAASLAARLGIHRTTLNRLFKGAMSITPGTYLAEIRLQHALSLLRESDLAVKEIAYECGLPHASYFCRLVKQETGFSPQEYRRRAGQAY